MSGRKQLQRDGFGALIKPKFFTGAQRQRIRQSIAKSKKKLGEKNQALLDLEVALCQLPTPWTPPLPSTMKGRAADMAKGLRKLHRAIQQAEDANKDIQRVVAIDTQKGTGRENELVIDIGQHLFVDDAFFSIEDWEAFKRVTAAFEDRAKQIMAACDRAKKTTHAKRDLRIVLQLVENFLERLELGFSRKIGGPCDVTVREIYKVYGYTKDGSKIAENPDAEALSPARQIDGFSALKN